MKNIDKYDTKRLKDLLQETRVKCVKEKRKLGMNKLKHYLFNKWNTSNPKALINPADDELEIIINDLVDTYRDPDESRYKMLSNIVEQYDVRVSNSLYRIKQFEDTITIIVDKIHEIENSKGVKP